MKITKLLNDIEKDKLVKFNEDTVLKGAVEKVLLYNIYNAETLTPGEPVGLDKHWIYGIPTQDPKVTDEEIGKLVKIKVAAMSFIEESFKELGEYRKEVEVKEDGENPAL